MLRLGKQEGWLHKPITEFQAWAELNNTSIQGVKCDTISGTEETSRSGVVALRPLVGEVAVAPLMVVPREMILSFERIEELKRMDGWHDELLKAVGEFGRVSFGF